MSYIIKTVKKKMKNSINLFQIFLHSPTDH